MRKIPKWLLLALLSLVGSLPAAAENAVRFQSLSIAGYFLTDRQGVTSSLTPLTDLPGLSVSPETGLVYGDQKWASGNQNAFTATVPFGYAISHWVYDATNFVYAAGTKVPDSDGKTFLVWNYTEDAGLRVSLAPVLIYDDRRTVTIGKSAFGRGTVGTNEGAHVCQAGDVFHLKAVPLRDEQTGFDHATFRRWSDGVTDYERSFVVETNMNLIAEFVPTSWQVVFNPCGGEAFPTSKVVTCDATYGSLPSATRAGYEFLGWYTDAASGNLRTANTVVEPVGDHALFARWNALQYSIAALVDRESENRGTVTGGGSYAYDTTATLTASAEEGFEFTGWTDGVTSRSRHVHVISNATYTATFGISYYDVTFGYYNAEGRWTNVVETVVYGNAATPPPEGETSTHDGLPFISWSSDEYKCVTRDLTITAQYETTFEVRFAYRNRDGQCVTGAVQRVRPGESASPPPLTVCDIWTGHQLLGWTPDYSTIGGDAIIVGEYDIRAYDVVFCYCNEVGKEQQHAERVLHGERVPFDYAESVKNLWPDHQFLYWSAEGKRIVDNYLVASNDMQVVAHYEGYQVISYEPNGGQGEMAAQIFTNYQGSVTLRANAYKKTGYEFANWTGSDGASYEEGAVVYVTDGFNLKLTANWQPITYTVVIDGNDGTFDSEKIKNPYPIQCTYDVITELGFNGEAFYRDGYKWSGLGTNRTEYLYERPAGMAQKDCKPVISNLTTTANASVTIYAIWKENDAESEALGLTNITVRTSVTNAWVVSEDGKSLQRTSELPDGKLLVEVTGKGTLSGLFEQDKKPSEKITVLCNNVTQTYSPGKFSLTPDAKQTIEFSGTPSSGKTWTLKGFVWEPSN